MSSLGKFYETSTSQSRSARQLPYRGEPLAKRESFTKCQSLPSLGATTTTAASGGNRESLLGPRPARRKQSAADAGCRNPGSGTALAVTERFSPILPSNLEIVHAALENRLILVAGDVLVQVLAAALRMAHLAEDTADRKSTRLNSSHSGQSRMPSSA